MTGLIMWSHGIVKEDVSCNTWCRVVIEFNVEQL